ncbi:MAG TPA: carboxypeptidase-like regulatory domain-containing protein [Bryobacteraceae bacterium]|nr:carboxypeptidase-like regulatory domain-containing protein [Bryobacteraceae bacterium]
MLVLSCIAAAQETRGMIFGRVLDSTSAAVAGASVMVVNEDTNISSRLTTNATGYYEAALLVPGTYKVTAELAGFKQTLRSGIVVLTSARVEVNMSLSVGEVSESITVTEQAPLLDTQSGLSGRTLDNKTQAGMPMSLGQMLPVVRFATGVQHKGVLYPYDTASQGNTSTNVSNEANVGGNQFALDGALTSGINRISGHLPHSDTIAEMKLETGGFDATIGQTSGLVITMLSKGGTNQLHGSASSVHNQNRWNATPFFTRKLYYQNIAAAEAAGNTAAADAMRAKDKQTSGRRNTFAATVGGPVVLPKIFDGRNKLFFFLSYSGDRWRTTLPSYELNHTFPSMAHREGDFSSLLNVNTSYYQIYDPLSIRSDPERAGHYVRTPIPGNVLPKSRITNPMYSSYAKLLPTPNNEPLDPTREPTNNYLGVDVPTMSTYDGLTNRLDFQPASKHRMFGRWTWDDYFLDMRDWAHQVVRGLQTTGGIRRNLGSVFDWVYTPTASTVIDWSASFHRYDSVTTSAPGARKFKPTDVGLPAYMDAFAGTDTMLPFVTASGYNTMGLVSERMVFGQTSMTKLDVTHIRSGHSLRGGVDVRMTNRNGGTNGYPSGYFSFSNAYTRREDDGKTPAANLGHSWASFMMGLGSWSAGKLDTYALKSPYYAGYLQDSWRVNRKWNINLGLRIEHEPGPVERFDRMLTYFDPTVQQPITGAAQAAYAAKPIPELAAANFKIAGGALYAGQNAPRNLVKSATMWLPRISTAYAVNSKLVIRAGYGIFQDTINALNLSPNQLNYSRSTGPILTNNFGMDWLIGDPVNGVSPIKDPFPVRADGTRFDTPLGNQLGTQSLLGGSWSGMYYDTPRARQQRWRVGGQRQFGKSMMLDVAYAGSYSDQVGVAHALNNVPEQYWADGLVRNDAIATNLNLNVSNPFNIANFASLQTSNPLLYKDLATKSFFTSSTIRKYQLLYPFPHMGTVTGTEPVGKVRTDAIEVTFERRFADGFNFYVGYTGLRVNAKDYYYNTWDTEPSWRKSNNARPHRFVATSVAELPFGKGKPFLKTGGPLNLLVGGWQLSVAYEYQPGAIVGFGNLFYYGNLADITSGEQTFENWFNTANFERVAAKGPAGFHRRVFPVQIDDLRAHSYSVLNGNLAKEFTVKEGVKVQVRWDVLNALNRTIMDAPNTTPTSTDFGRVTTSTSLKRWMQVQAKVTF